MSAVFKREMQAYYLTPIGYVFMGCFLLVSGIFFVRGNLLQNSANIGNYFNEISFVFIFITPILTMRLFSEERRTKTDQLLLTSPTSLWGIVLGKFLAASLVFAVTLVVTLIYMIVLNIYGYPANVEGMVVYLGFFLMGCCFIAIGSLMSALSENQVTAAISTFGVALLVYLMDIIIPYLTFPFLGPVTTVLGWLSINTRFAEFSYGILNLSSIVYMVSFIAVFLFLTVRSIEKRRWSEG